MADAVDAEEDPQGAVRDVRVPERQRDGLRLVRADAEQHAVLPPVFPVLHVQHRRGSGQGRQGRGVHVRRRGVVREDELLAAKGPGKG